MKRIGRLFGIIIAVVLLTQTISVYAADYQLPSGISAVDLEKEVTRFTSEHADTSAGMAVAVFDSESELLKKYYGYEDKENGITVDADSVFEWGSVTKLLVWVSVMQLYEQGKIDLEEDIRTYLPDGFCKNLKYDTPVTMLNLMNHNAGFQESLVDIFVKDSDYFTNLEEAVAAHEPAQIYEPGTVTSYSNWGVSLAACVVERVSGLSFDKYVHKNIFEPLGMEQSAVLPDLSDNPWVQEKRKELQCYTTEGERLENGFYNITLFPSGMCTGTLNDFEKFARALLEEDTVLFQNQDTLKEMFSPTSYFGDSDIPRNFHGFWMLPFGVCTVGHGGNSAGCSSYLLLDLQERLGAVVMTNQSYETVYNEQMMELVFGKYERDIYTEEKEIPQGIYRSARTVRKGPHKLFSLSYCMGEVDEEELWIADSSAGIDKIVYTYGDYVRVPVSTFVLEMALILLWGAALLFSLVALFVKFFCFLIRKCKKKGGGSTVLAKWSTGACLLQFGLLLVIGIGVNGVMSFSLSQSYLWTMAVSGLLSLVMCGMTFYGIIKNRKSASRKAVKLFYYMTATFMGVAVFNVLYWEIYRFWAL